MELIVFAPDQLPARQDTITDIPAGGFVWVDFNRRDYPDWAEHFNRMQWCAFEVHERHVKDSLNSAHPPYFDSMPHYEMLIFRGFCSEDPDSELATTPVTFFLFERCLVTVRSFGNHSVKEMYEHLLQAPSRVPSRPEGLMHLILDAMVDRFLLMRGPLSDDLDHWRDALLESDNAFAEWRMLMNRRSELRKLETLCEQQVDSLAAWREDTRCRMDDYLIVRFNDLQEHIHRVLHYVQSLQTEIDFLMQLQFSAAAQGTNRTMSILTGLSAVFMPLHLIAGLFGMNFAHMPLVDHPYGFYSLLLGMIAAGAGLFALFKLKRWI